MKAPYLVVLQHHDVPSITRIIAPLTLPQRGDHDSIAPPIDVKGTEYRARLLDLAAHPRSVPLETVASAERQPTRSFMRWASSSIPLR
jgi:hypothetical protein